MPAVDGAEITGRTSLPVPAVDTSKPSIARVYDYWLGGKDHFAADRAEAERLLAIYPDLPRLARENRQFQARAISWLAAQGIGQFLDIGPGCPPRATPTRSPRTPARPAMLSTSTTTWW
jgi:hypothetical protein